MKNLMIAGVAWTVVFFVVILLVPYSLPPGCGNLGRLTDECRQNTEALERSIAYLPYRQPFVILVGGYVVLVGARMAHLRTRGQKRQEPQ